LIVIPEETPADVPPAFADALAEPDAEAEAAPCAPLWLLVEGEDFVCCAGRE
jgi:hypothetical protein